MMYNTVATLSTTQIILTVYYYLPVKYVTESRRNISVDLFQSHRPGMGQEELEMKEPTN